MTHRTFCNTLLAFALGATCAVAAAQGAASAPASGPGPGAGPRGMMSGGGMRGWQMNRDNTPGWAMMSPTERNAHRDKMLSMSNYEECKAYMDQHHAQMVDRAKQRGRTAPSATAPRHDPCARLKK